MIIQLVSRAPHHQDTRKRSVQNSAACVFFMQNRGKLSFLWQFTLFVVSSRIAVGIRSSLALENRKTLTITQKGFLHDIPIGEYLEVFADVRILSE